MMVDHRSACLPTITLGRAGFNKEALLRRVH
jgi:hypothetical protein